MIVKYNKLNRLEVPKLTLCNPGSVFNDGCLTKFVGILNDHEAEELCLNFNATSELNFRVNRVRRENSEENSHTYSLYKSVQNRRLIFVDDIGYFMITNVEDGYEDKKHFKDVKAQSIDVEIQQKMIPYIADGTYKFTSSNSGTAKGIIETVVETLPLWRIGHIDESVASRWRTFEDIDTSLNCLGFLMDNVQDAYECIFIFDIINRVINVYDQTNYVRQTDIHITKDDLINTLDIAENSDDLYTAISVMGDKNVTISAINPLGTNVIYNFDYYLGWMSDKLSSKVLAWQNAISASADSYYALNLQYYNKLAEASDIHMEIEKYATQITMYTRCRNNIVAESNTALVGSYNKVIVDNGGTAISVCEEISDTISNIDNLISICTSHQDNANTCLDTVNGTLNSIREQIESVHSSLSITSYFSANEYTELCHYIFEGSYSDEYITITDNMTYTEKFSQMKILFDRAKSRLERVSKPTQEFNIDAENFIFMHDFEHWSKQLETGCLINVELGTDDIALLFLSNITINYDDRSLKMTFGNRFNKFDSKSLFENVLGDISKSANTLSFIKEVLYPIKNGEFDLLKEAVQTSRNLTMINALASEGEEIVIDGSGYTGKKLLPDGTYDSRQVKLNGRNLVFTDDSWDTCKIAIGDTILGDNNSVYGVIADSIVGNIIAGNSLTISAMKSDYFGNSVFVVDGDGCNLNNCNLSIRNENGTNQILLSPDIGLAIGTYPLKTISNGTPVINDANAKFWTDIEGNVHLKGTLHGVDGTFAGKLEAATGSFAGKLEAATGSFAGKLEAATGTFAGKLEAATGSFVGKLEAATGNIGSWTIGTNCLSSTVESDENEEWSIYLSSFPYYWHDNDKNTGRAADALCIRHKDSSNNYTYPFVLRKDGSVYMSNCHINGGELSIHQESLYFSSSHTYVADDVRSAIRIAVGLDIPTDEQISLYDVDGDGYVTAADVRYISRKVVSYDDNYIYDTKITKSSISGLITKSGSPYINFVIGGSRSYFNKLQADNLSSDYIAVDYIDAVTLNYENNASDIKIKNSIENIPEQYDMLFDKISPKRFKYNFGTSNRYHTGFIAQEIDTALRDCNMTATDFAALDHLSIAMPNGAEWVVHREEIVALNTWQIQMLKTRVAQLESQLIKLCANNQ